MEIDNEVYNRLGATWWEESNPLNMLHGSITPGRFEYFRDVLVRLGRDLPGMHTLDVGCGGGFMAERFARLGCRVAGVDLSPVSIEAARHHARSGGLDIDYRVGSADRLPFADHTFDLTYCCDVLEHLPDVQRAITEAARVLKPGGVYLFDTVNRTRFSRLLAIKALQEWRFTKVFDSPVHVWEMFIRPADLGAMLRRAGLVPGEVVGLGPRIAAPRIVRALVQARRGRITYGELSRRLNVGRIKNTRMSYMGYATNGPAAAGTADEIQQIS